MKVAVLQSSYIPWKGYFDLIHDADLFLFYDDVKYTKNDWRNRNRIASKNGTQWLTIPIAKEAVNQLVQEVELPQDNWQEKHYRTLCFTYGKAPFFHQLEPLLNRIYKEWEWKTLSELNQSLILEVMKELGIHTQVSYSTAYQLTGQRGGRLLDLLKQVGAAQYISGPAAHVYLDPISADFGKEGIELVYKNYDNYPEYIQLGPTFDHFVSILDMIANVDYSEIPQLIWGWRDQAVRA